MSSIVGTKRSSRKDGWRSLAAIGAGRRLSAAGHGAECAAAPNQATHAQADRHAGAAAQPRSGAGESAISISRRESRASRRSEFLPNLYAGSGAAYTNGFPILAEGGAPALFNLTYDEDALQPAGAQRHSGGRAEGRAAAAGRSRTPCAMASSCARPRPYLELAKVRRELDLMRRGRESAQKILDFTKATDGGRFRTAHRSDQGSADRRPGRAAHRPARGPG